MPVPEGANLGNAHNPYANLDRRKDARERRVGIIGVYFLKLISYVTLLSVPTLV
jgi:hypothetical protein